jgi:hypothetical protein
MNLIGCLKSIPYRVINQSWRMSLLIASLSINFAIAQVPKVDLGQPVLPREEPVEPAVRGPLVLTPVSVSPGQNLFGDKISNTEEPKSKDVSQTQTRVQGMIDQTLSLVAKQEEINLEAKQLGEKIFEKSTSLEQLKNRYEATTGQIILANEKMNRLSPALNFSPKHPQFQEYFRIKAIANGYVADLQLMDQQRQTIPVEIRNLNAEQLALQNKQQVIYQDLMTLNSGWLETLNIFAVLPKEDAQAIVKECNLKLDRHPSVYPIRMMKGAGLMQQNLMNDAKNEFGQVYQAVQTQNDPMSKSFRLRALVAMAWAELSLGELDDAGAHLSEARKILPRDYEAAVCMGHLEDLRGKPKASFDAYRNATSIAPQRPEGLRMAAEMVVKTEVRPPQTALQLATLACKYDSHGDFRNSLALARAQFASGKQAEGREAISKAYEQAGDEHKSIVQAVEQELAKP